MEAFVTQQFTEAVKKELLGRYGILPADCSSLGGFENLVFKVVHKGKEAILRVTHGSHRNAQAIEGELDFMIHLKQDGLHVPAIYRSESGLNLESTGSSWDDFHAVLFEKSPGRPPNAADAGPKLFRIWGQAIGLMHRSVQDYDPPAHIRRENWDEEDLLANAANYLPQGYERHLQLLEEVVAEIRSWPISPGIFGLIHADLHQNNFFLDGDTLIAFDFDDAAYHWLVYDIAVVLFSSADRMRGNQSYQAYADAFMPPFMEGYNSEFELPDSELKRIPTIIRFRELILVVALHKKLGPDRFDARALELLNSINERILNGKQVFEPGAGPW